MVSGESVAGQGNSGGIRGWGAQVRSLSIISTSYIRALGNYTEKYQAELLALMGTQCSGRANVDPRGRESIVFVNFSRAGHCIHLSPSLLYPQSLASGRPGA